MKAILVIDVPMLDDGRHLCNECPLLDMKGVIEDTDDYGYCMAKAKEMKPKWDGAFPIFKKPRWCPLKPMPEKKKPDNPDESWEEMHERWGYNKCIEEIEK